MYEFEAATILTVSMKATLIEKLHCDHYSKLQILKELIMPMYYHEYFLEY